jgi:hypothetical protein
MSLLVVSKGPCALMLQATRAGRPCMMVQEFTSVPKMVVTGVDGDGARDDRDRDSDDPENDDLELAGRRHLGRSPSATQLTPGLRAARYAASLIPIIRRAERRRLVRSSGVRRIPEIPRIA